MKRLLRSFNSKALKMTTCADYLVNLFNPKGLSGFCFQFILNSLSFFPKLGSRMDFLTRLKITKSLYTLHKRKFLQHLSSDGFETRPIHRL